MGMRSRYGGIEAGGTKFVCAMGSGPDDLSAHVQIPTTTPAETIGRAIDFFRDQSGQAPLAAIGIGAFGPLDPDQESVSFGYITTTPKAGWARTDLVGPIRSALGVPIAFDTDVNASALGEHRWGAARGLDNFIYLTVGTGIGGGAILNGGLVHGLIHPEMGHIRIPHDWEADPYGGSCSFHGDCLEGLACGPAIHQRWSESPKELPPDHPAWALEARYVALGVASLVCAISPQRVVIGGGVMRQQHLFPAVRRNLLELLNGYIRSPTILDEIESFIVPPALGDLSGVLGAMALAHDIAEK